MDFIYLMLAFIVGYVFSEYRADQNKKQLLKATNKIFELNSYVILGQLGEMHDLGLKALGLAYEKCLEVDQTQKEELEQFIKTFDKKMEEFGDFYIANLKKSLTHKIKFNTYKEVKENFKNLFSDIKEAEKNA
jgi:hypothetical protein